MGVPVIATTVGGPAEVITQRRDGMLVPPRKPEAWARAIKNLIKSPVLSTRLARNGRLRARAFAVEAHVEELRREYLQVLKRRHRQGEAPAGIHAPPVGGTAVGRTSTTPSARAA